MLNTIGYEGARPSDFVQTLKVAGVEMIVDIRDRAQSRRSGFSKTALSTLLLDGGIEYRHYRELGDPKEGREAARAKDMARFNAIFAQVLQTAPAQAALKEIAEISVLKSLCLLCYERDHHHCHRKVVADRIEAITGRRARHLGVRQFEPAFK